MKNHMRPTLLTAFALACVLVFVVGCSDATTPNDPVVVVIPKTGSFFVLEYTTVPSTTTMRDTVYAVISGVTRRGKSNAVGYHDHSASNDTSFVSYAQNGDVFLWTGDDANYLPLKIASKSDTTWIDSLGYGMAVIPRTNTISYAGSETLTVVGNAVLCHIIKHEMRARLEGVYGLRETMTYWFAPSIGFFAKLTLHKTDTTDTGTKEGNQTQTLVDYNVK